MPGNKNPAVNLAHFGSLPMAERTAVWKGGLRRINGRQVKLLKRMAADAGYSDERLLEIVKEECKGVPGAQVDAIGDCLDAAPVQNVVQRLRVDKENK